MAENVDDENAITAEVGERGAHAERRRASVLSPLWKCVTSASPDRSFAGVVILVLFAGSLTCVLVESPPHAVAAGTFPRPRRSDCDHRLRSCRRRLPAGDAVPLPRRHPPGPLASSSPTAATATCSGGTDFSDATSSCSASCRSTRRSSSSASSVSRPPKSRVSGCAVAVCRRPTGAAS